MSRLQVNTATESRPLKLRIRKFLLASDGKTVVFGFRCPDCFKWSIIEPGAQMDGHKPARCLHCKAFGVYYDFGSAIARMKQTEDGPANEFRYCDGPTPGTVEQVRISLPELYLP